MEIVKQNIDDLNALLKVKVAKPDYEEKVKKVLKDYQKKAVVNGFRPGKVPASYIEKMYGKPVLLDEINKLVSDGINDYLKNNNIQILGEPLPSLNENKPINWDVDTEFEFAFELGLQPEISVTVSDKDKIDYYEIKVDDKMIENYTDGYTRRYGKFTENDVIVENELLKVDISQNKENGIKVENVSLALEYFKDQDIKKKFAGLKANDKISVDLKKALENEYEISTLLNIKKDQVAEIDTDFEVTIKTISRFDKAELNQQLFDQVFGENAVTSEEQFRQRIIDDIKASLERESDYKLRLDAKDYYLKKTKLELPKDFLIRWMVATNEGKFTHEQVDKEYPMFEENLKWSLLKNTIAKAADIKVADEDVKSYAKELARRQFRQYGIYNVTDDYLEDYAGQMLKRQEDLKQIIDNVVDDKVLKHIKDNVKLNKKDITAEDFNKMFEK